MMTNRTETSYVHYWHFYRRWYAEVNDNPTSQRVYWHNSFYVQSYWNEKCLIKDSEWMTEREARAKLKELYPDFILIKDKPFHQGRRWKGNKEGSRS